MYGDGFGVTLIGGESRELDRVRAMLLDAVESLRRTGICAADFERIQKKLYGRAVRQLNSVDRVASLFVDLAFLQVDFADYMQAYLRWARRVRTAAAHAFCSGSKRHIHYSTHRESVGDRL